VNDSTNNSGNTRPKRKWLFPLGVAAIAISSVVVVSCFHDDDPTTASFDDGGGELPVVEEGTPLEVVGNGLFCDTTQVNTGSTVAATLKVEAPDSIQAMNISFDEPGESWLNHNAANNLKRLTAVVTAENPDGTEATEDDGNGVLVPIGDVHPLIVSYGEQVIGLPEPGDGSADIADPDNVDDIFTSLSLDNGKSWKKMQVGDTAKSTSKDVAWGDNNLITKYPGHSHKPTMHIQGNNILVAWNDKYCPSGDPFDLIDKDTGELTSDQIDTYKVNGTQGTVDYGGVVAPNDKVLYEVPYSCVWTARGEFVVNPEDDGSTDIPSYVIQWRQAKQLTSGTRDSNKIWIAPAEVGFAITWQEDPDGLRPGKGEGPGVGYSGATTNHGADIWYTYIDMTFFDDVCADPEDLDCTTVLEDPTPADILALGQKPKAAVNFTYPVRITNNEICTPDDFDVNDLANSKKPWCADNCIDVVKVESNNSSSGELDRCVQNDLDYMTAEDDILPAAAILDGDTGASRPALKLLKTDAPLNDAGEPEVIAILAYEETKGLSDSNSQDQGETVTDIALEGKAVYFESFFWNKPVAVSASRVVNLRVPKATVDDEGNVTVTEDIIYENARRVVILPQVDACDTQEGDPTFALLYKQGYETQGGPSDMFVRVNEGFTFDTFVPLDGRDATNVSSHGNTDAENGTGTVLWTTDNLLDQSYTYPYALDNTFSPRGWLRGGEVYIGFEYSPRWKATQTGTVPNNFWIHRFVENAWQGPMQLSIVTGARTSTLDPRFIPTPKGIVTDADLASDKSNPNVIFLGYGTFDMDSSDELDLFYTRSTDKGATWEYLDGNGDLIVTTIFGDDGEPGTADDPARLARLAARQIPVHEMELQGLASPDGTMFFGAWLREVATVDNIHQDGRESEFGRVDYDTDVVVAPE